MVEIQMHKRLHHYLCLRIKFLIKFAYQHSGRYKVQADDIQGQTPHLNGPTMIIELI